MSKKPAAMMVATKLRAGAYPTVLEFGALLRGNGEAQAEARALAIRYQNATAARPSTEDAFMALLRAFSLRQLP